MAKLYLKKLTFLLVLVTFTSFSQEKNNATLLPKSIYFTPLDTLNFNSNYSINKKLNLNSFSFFLVDLNKVENGYFTYSTANFNNHPTEFIYDSYNKVYNNLQLKKSFFNVDDLYKFRGKNPK